MYQEDDYIKENFNNNASDIEFVNNLNNFIDTELVILKKKSSKTYLDGGGNEREGVSVTKERYLIFKQAFSELIDYVQVYKALLSSIKSEYESCIELLETKKADRLFARSEIIKIKKKNQTIVNLEQEKVFLEAKLKKLCDENGNLVESLKHIMELNEKFRPKPVDKYSFLLNKENPSASSQNDHIIKMIPGLSLENSLDLDYLSSILTMVEAKIVELNEAQTRKYTNKQLKNDLQNQFFAKIAIRDNVLQERHNIKNKLFLFKLAMTATKEYYNSNKYGFTSIYEALTKTLAKNYLARQKSFSHKQDDDGDGQEEDVLEDEAELLLDYIEKFNDLFENKKFIEAAYFAAASPRNILRNAETLFRFKDKSENGNFTEKNDPLLVYCVALIDSVDESSGKITEAMSLECVKVALKYNKLDLLTRWIAKRKLMLSHASGKIIEEYARLKPKNHKNAYELALFIYQEIKSLSEASICMAKLGRFSAMLDFIDQNSKQFNSSKSEIFLKIFSQHPCPDLANLIMKFVNKDEIIIPVDKLVQILLDSDQPENGLIFLKAQIDRYSEGDETSEELRKLKTSFDTLVKFSFLSTNDDQFTKEIALESRDQLQSILKDSPTNNEKEREDSKNEDKNMKQKNPKTIND